MKILRSYGLVLLAALALCSTALGATPKKLGAYVGHTSQNGSARLQLDVWGAVMDASFDYGCDGAEPTRFTQALWRVTPKKPHLKVTKTGSFSYSGTVKTWELPRPLSFSDPSAPFQKARLTIHGRFTSATKAGSTVRISGAGCDSGAITWTATLGGK